MIRFRRLTCAPPMFESDEYGLTQNLQREVMRFEECAVRAGLPWIDKVMYRSDLLHDASVSSLLRITKLNRLLDQQADLAQTIVEHCRKREEVINKLLMTCAFDHAHQECTHASHRAACDALRLVDDETDEIVRLIQKWRLSLVNPLPFIVDGENYLLRMNSQIAVGKGLAHVGGHLRNTCRHLQYFYASGYDPVVVENNKVLQREQMFVLQEEMDIQGRLLEESLRLARMGMYQPVLRFKHRAGASTSVPPMVMLDNKKWKNQLILSFVNGLTALSKSRPVQDLGITSAMMQFAGVASKVLHKRYYLLWNQFRKRRIERRRAIFGMALMADMIVTQRYFHNWTRRLVRVKEMLQRSTTLLQSNHNALRRRYMQKLFLKTATKRAERLVKRAMSLRYFRALQYRATMNILRGQRKVSSGSASEQKHNDMMTKYPWLESLHMCGGNAPFLDHLRGLITSDVVSV